MSPQASDASAHPPETLEGWYSLHQVFAFDHKALGLMRGNRGASATRVDSTQQGEKGWSAWARLIGSRADLLVIHFAPTLDDIAVLEDEVRRSPLVACGGIRLTDSFLSVTEAGLYHITAQLAKDAAARGGAVGDETYKADLERRVAAERGSPHVRKRLYPELPGDMPYVCFYPMSKRRDTGQNWYTLSLDERSRLMWAHGNTGRRYAGRVLQIITGAIGFENWEWGVTLFAKDPLDFKKLLTEMRFDEASARYAEFGDFYVGKLVSDLSAVLETPGDSLS